MYIVYILKSINFEKFYTGKTNDLERRFLEHNSGKSYYTRRYLPWKIIYKEFFPDEADAVRREKYFKSHAGREWLKKNVNAS